MGAYALVPLARPQCMPPAPNWDKILATGYTATAIVVVAVIWWRTVNQLLDPKPSW